METEKVHAGMRMGKSLICSLAALVVSGVGTCLAGSGNKSDQAWEALRTNLKNRPRTLILNSDGNELVYFPTNAPITIEGFVSQRLQKYVGSKISTISYCPWSSGFGLMSTTRAGELFDVPINFQKGCTNAVPLFAAKGLDCLDMTADFCRSNGMEVFVSIRVNDTHDRWYMRPGTNPPRSWMFPKWKAENPDCLFGTDKKGPPFCSWTAVDFENPKTRDYMKKFVSDFVSNYDVDGIEYDFLRHGQLFKSVGWGAYATDEQLELMTDFMKELRTITERAGRKRGRPILVMVRTPDSLGYARGIGIDVKAWLKAGVMDIWSVSDYFQLDYLRPNVKLAHKYGVKFYSALAESRVMNVVKRKKLRCLQGRDTISSFAAEYSVAKAAGCDGVVSFNLSCIWNTVNAPKLLKIDPWETDAVDKIYFALVRGSGGYLPESWLKDGGKFYRRPRIDPGNAPYLANGEPFTFTMELGDVPGNGKRCLAKAMFDCEDPIVKSIVMNGREIALREFDGGVHIFELDISNWRKGLNEFSLTPDGEAGQKVAMNDFAVFVDKLNHRKELRK